MELSIYIADLLLKHECVVLPEFGGFITQRQSAKMAIGGGSFTPPNKRILFNENLRVNDGLLFNHLVVREKLSEKDASLKIEQYVASIKKTIEEKNLVTLSNIGKFYMDKENNLQFTPDQSKNLDVNAFGLGSINVSPINRTPVKKETENSKVTPKPRLKVETPKAENKKPKRINWVTLGKAAAIVVLCSTIGFQVYDKDLNVQDFNAENSKSFNFSSFSSLFSDIIGKEKTTQKTVYKKAEIVTSEVKETSKEIVKEEIKEPAKPKTKYIKAPIAKVQPKQKVEKIATKKAPVKKSVSNKRKPIFLDQSNYKEIYIIVGAFGSKKNADKMVKKLAKKNLKGHVLSTSNGLYRIGIDGFSNFEEAANTLVEAKKSFAPSAWILGKSE